LDYFEKYFEEIADGSTDHLVVGDFNIDMSKNTSESNRLRNLVDKCGLKQYIKEYTRVAQHHRTTIDLVISNNFTLTASVLNSPKITDHAIIKICGTSKNKTDQVEKRTVTTWKNYSKEAFNHELEKVNYSELKNLNFQEKADKIIEVLETNLKKTVKNHRN
jgi:Endonuclease-reverse transcriptase